MAGIDPADIQLWPKSEVSMSDRKQQKLGWIVGWSGGFIWVLILSIVLAARGQFFDAGAGFLLAGIAISVIAFAAPWRNPQTPYRLLMVPIYFVLLMSLIWAVRAWGGPQEMGFSSWWSLLVLIPVLIPLWTVGNRRWENG